MEVQMKVYSNTVCNQDEISSERNGELWDTVVCAFTDTDRTEDTCQGDSGGPLMVDTDTGDTHQYVVAALASWGVGCGEVPGVYADVGSYETWVKANVPEATFRQSFTCDNRWHEEGGPHAAGILS
eukprot:UN30631